MLVQTSLRSILQGCKVTPSQLFNDDSQTRADLRVHGRTSDIPPTGTGRHTGLHTARDPLVIELAIHPHTNLVDWWIVDASTLRAILFVRVEDI